MWRTVNKASADVGNCDIIELTYGWIAFSSINATDKALAGEVKVMWERIIFGIIVVFMSLPWIIVLGKITNKL